jgi:hypothetical protein
MSAVIDTAPNKSYYCIVMRATAVFLLCILCTLSAAQEPSSSPATSLSKEDYLRKSESQQYLAKVFLIGGSAMMFTGMIGYSSAVESSGGAGAYGYMFVGGSLLALTSVPLFISASRNDRKASAAIALQPQRIDFVPQKNSPTWCPALTLTIRVP